MGNGSGTTNWDSGLNVPESMWSFVALVITPQSGAVYVYNATAQAAAANSANPMRCSPSIAPRSLATFPPTQPEPRQFNGYIDEVAVFNQALTEDQINTLYTAGSGTDRVCGAGHCCATFSTLVCQRGIRPWFTVSVLASSGVTYVWTLNGVILTNGDNGFAGTLFAGASTATLTISNYTGALAGLPIQVAVYNPSDATPATSSVTLPPTIPTPAIWTTGFCITNSSAPGIYAGVGVISGGTQWNGIDDEGPDDPAFNGGPWTSTSSFNDTGALNTGVTVTVPLAGIETLSALCQPAVGYGRDPTYQPGG